MPYADPSSPAAIESRRRASKKYYLSHRQQEIGRARSYNQTHADRVNKLSVLRRSTKMPVERVLYWNAENRAKAQGIEFDLTIEDIDVPEFCPVLGIPLKVATRAASANSPSLDRVDPSKGYVRGNVQVISHRANTIKSDARLDELRAVVKYMERS